MKEATAPEEKKLHFQEITPKAKNGMAVLLLNLVLMLASVAGIVFSGITIDDGRASAATVVLLVAASFTSVLWVPSAGGAQGAPAERGYVQTLFGRYYGTLKGEGFFFVNPSSAR